jgi:LmbE family N-acetylglucosaminyl deacetylase
MAQRPAQKWHATLLKIMQRPAFAWTALAILLTTTIYWSAFSALIHFRNADELVDPRLVASWDNFRQAHFPEAHTFLLKWPLFWLISAVGYSKVAFIGMTIFVTLATVGFLAFLIHRIEKRPAVRGTLYLLVAAILLPIAAEPHINALLPTNIAMLATRNIEYIFLLGALWLATSTTRHKVLARIGAWALLTLLFASDMLFPPLAIGGGVFYLGYQILFKKREQLRPVLVWLGVAIGAYVAAKLLIAGIGISGITSIERTTALGPYDLTFSFVDKLKAIFFSGAAVLTNLGLNPFVDIPSWRDISLKSISTVNWLGMLGYIARFAAVLGIVFYLIRHLWGKKAPKAWNKQYAPTQLRFWLLICMTAIAFIAFVATKHTYAVDARYVYIGFFATIIGIALYGTRYKQKTTTLWPVIALLSVISIVFSLPGAYERAVLTKQSRHTITQNNQFVINAIKQQPHYVLVGDYWRTLPIHQAQPSVKIMPMGSCTSPRTALTTDAWKIDTKKTSLAYLLTIESQQRASPSCSYEQIVKEYGIPNNTIVVGGTQLQPKELLLFYERDATKLHKTPHINTGDDVVDLSYLPKSLQYLATAEKVCEGKTTLNIVAHQDDDILFMNPNLMHSLGVTDCMRTLYVTAGDAGRNGKNNPYWLGRERGAQSAYAKMYGFSDEWTTEPLDLGEGAIVAYSTPRDHRFERRVSLVFLRLPEGNVNGKGFPANKHFSLQKFSHSPDMKVQSVDGAATYTYASLQESVQILIESFEANIVNTQSTYAGVRPRDHSDHNAIGTLVRQVVEKIKTEPIEEGFERFPAPQVVYYHAYPATNRPKNVVGDELQRKQEIFMSYAKHDGAVCQTIHECYTWPSVYGGFLDRQYTE